MRIIIIIKMEIFVGKEKKIIVHFHPLNAF